MLKFTNPNTLHNGTGIKIAHKPIVAQTIPIIYRNRSGIQLREHNMYVIGPIIIRDTITRDANKAKLVITHLQILDQIHNYHNLQLHILDMDSILCCIFLALLVEILQGFLLRP
jgi:hypothetical protein